MPALNSWVVAFSNRRPLNEQPLVRIPNGVRLALSGNTHDWDGRVVGVEIWGSGALLWRGSLSVTSGGELYVRKKARDAVSRETMLTFVLSTTTLDQSPSKP